MRIQWCDEVTQSIKIPITLFFMSIPASMCVWNYIYCQTFYLWNSTHRQQIFVPHGVRPAPLVLGKRSSTPRGFCIHAKHSDNICQNWFYSLIFVHNKIHPYKLPLKMMFDISYIYVHCLCFIWWKTRSRVCCIQLRGFLASVWFAKSKYQSLPNGCQGSFPIDQFNA